MGVICVPVEGRARQLGAGYSGSVSGPDGPTVEDLGLENVPPGTGLVAGVVRDGWRLDHSVVFAAQGYAAGPVAGPDGVGEDQRSRRRRAAQLAVVGGEESALFGQRREVVMGDWAGTHSHGLVPVGGDVDALPGAECEAVHGRV